jgi:hypothetical protein
MDQQADRIERRLNIDFVMSVCALLISAGACATTLYQLRNASLTMSAQTWPYVTAGWHYDNGEAGILVTNDGQGLAIVHAAILAVDGQPQHDVVSALHHLINGKEGILQVDALVHGIVIRPGQTLRLLMVRGANWDTQLLAARKRISVALCYCSVLERCWTNTLDGLPREVEHCAEAASLALPGAGDEN